MRGDLRYAKPKGAHKTKTLGFFSKYFIRIRSQTLSLYGTACNHFLSLQAKTKQSFSVFCGPVSVNSSHFRQNTPGGRWGSLRKARPSPCVVFIHRLCVSNLSLEANTYKTKYCIVIGAGRDGRVGASVGSTGRVGAASFFLATNRD